MKSLFDFLNNYLLIGIIVFVFIFLIVLVYFMLVNSPKLTKEEIDYINNKHIILNKEKYPKLTIQKAQQGVDEYLSTKKK